MQQFDKNRIYTDETKMFNLRFKEGQKNVLFE